MRRFPRPPVKAVILYREEMKERWSERRTGKMHVIFKAECFQHSNGRSVSYFKGHLHFILNSHQKKNPETETLEEWLSAATLKRERQTLAHNSGAWALESGDQTNPVLNIFPCLT